MNTQCVYILYSKSNYAIGHIQDTLRMNLKNLGETVRKLRRDRNWSQSDLALRCDTTPVSISRIETRRHGASPPLLNAIARAFDLEIHQLMALAEGALPYNTAAPAGATDEAQLLDAFRRLPAAQRRLLLDLGKALVGHAVNG
jgi:transcriptional regulator with XRE-family HTH domain